MAEIVDRYLIETGQTVKNLTDVEKQLIKTSETSKKTATQVNQDMVSAARGGQMLTKQYNGLNVAVSQFARELPNAAQSAQIFFMSIGNNFGQLQDSIQRINAQNKELIAQGKPAQSVFKQLAASIFSVSTALNVGVLVLVLYGKEIGNLLSSLFKGGVAIDQVRQRFETLNKAFESKSVLKAVSDIEDLRRNIDLARKGFIDKKDVIEQYNKSIGETTGQVTSLDEAEKALNKNAAAFIQLTLLKAAAQQANEEASAAQLEAMKETIKEEQQLQKDIQTRIRFEGDDTGLDQFLAQARDTEIKKRRSDSEKRIKDLKEVADRLKDEAARIAKENNFDFFGDITSDEAKAKKAQQEAIERLREFWRLYELEAARVRPKSIVPQFGDITGADEAGLPDGLLPSIAPKIAATEMTINELLDAINLSRKNGEKEYTKFLEAELDRRLLKRKEEGDKEIENEKILRQKIKDLTRETASNLFDLRANLENAATDERVKRLEEERQKELEVEGLTLEQRKAIEEEYDQKRSAILNRNARIQRNLELANILVQTALATISELARGGPPAAALAAITGALAFGFASAQPLPQYALGTERVTGGIRGKDSVHALLMPDEAVIKSSENMRHPGLARAWNEGRLESFLAMKYIEPVMNEIYRKDAARINNTFVNNNKVGLNDKRIVRNIQESNMINKLMLRELRKNKGSNFTDRRFWN